jgi:ribose 5-phosphate isomerase
MRNQQIIQKKKKEIWIIVQNNNIPLELSECSLLIHVSISGWGHVVVTGENLGSKFTNYLFLYFNFL